MTSKNSKQMMNWKAFEYALLMQFQEKLQNKTTILVVENSALLIAKDCFYGADSISQADYLLTASFAVNFLMDIEPRLSHDIWSHDVLELEIASDERGKKGDVRDILLIRAVQKWEIGVSAKNNHNAVKHSRLSGKIDFWKEWVGIPVSQEYFSKVRPIFSQLAAYRSESHATMKWSELWDYHTTVYIPVLTAFMEELWTLSQNNPEVASRLVEYLVWKQDFYKIVKKKNAVEIYAYNIHGTLNLPFDSVLSKYVTPQVVLPTEILDISFKEKSNNTLIVTLNNHWKLSLRIHNASSRIEPSLKFDINLVEAPNTLFKNTLHISTP